MALCGGTTRWYSGGTVVVVPHGGTAAQAPKCPGHLFGPGCPVLWLPGRNLLPVHCHTSHPLSRDSKMGLRHLDYSVVKNQSRTPGWETIPGSVHFTFLSLFHSIHIRYSHMIQYFHESYAFARSGHFLTVSELKVISVKG